MKKFLCVVFILTLLLTGCSRNQNSKNIKPVSQNFTSDVEMNYSKNNFKATVTRKAECTQLDFTFPRAVNGLSVTKTDDECKMKFVNMEISSERIFVPQKALINVIDGIFDILADPSQYSVKKQGENYVYTGSFNSYDFELVRNKDSLAVISLSLASENINIEFSNFVDAT